MMRLSARELEILTGAAEGETIVLTGDRLFISHKTVKVHRANIIKKMRARNMTHAVALALVQNLISIEEEELYVTG